MVSQIRVGRLTPGKERDADSAKKCWWFNVKLDVSMTLRSNRKTTTIRYACTPPKASWECHRQVEGDAPSACRDRSIHLVRGPGDEILLQNRNSGLPITGECDSGNRTAIRTAVDPQRRPHFRLTRMPIRQCQL